MSEVNVAIREDTNHPEGGHAVIELTGVKAKPLSDAFSLEPVDSNLNAADMKGWPSGERTPLKTRMSPAGFEIMIGPDVVESPVLLPGTPVLVKVPGAGVSREVLWPDIKPLRRQKVKRIITSTDRRDSMARMQAQKEQAAQAAMAAQVAKAAHAAQAAKSTSGAGAPSGAAGSADKSTSANVTKLNTGGARQPAQSLARAIHSSDVNSGKAARAPSANPTGQEALDGGNRSRLSSLADSGATLSGAQMAAGSVPNFADHAPSGGGLGSGGSGGSQFAGDAVRLQSPKSATGLAPAPAASADSATTVNPAVDPAVFAPDHGAEADGLSRGTADGAGSGSQSASRRSGLIAAAALAATLGVVGYLYINRTPAEMSIETGPAPGVVSTPDKTAAEVARREPKPAPLFDAIAAQSMSPRGNRADEVSGTEAITRAYRAVSGASTPRDTEEGAFWLRQYLAKKIGDKQTLWALTQLGSTYARPTDGAPNYETARQLWEIAAGLGDPVASCFLGGLYEAGLGVAVNKAQALKWYEVAGKRGGCPNLDAAMARLRK